MANKRNPKMMLLEKIWLIAVENPVIECGLKGEDDEGRYGICEAAAVFRMYNEAFEKHKVHFFQVSKVTEVGKNYAKCDTIFRIADVETGYVWPFPIPGSGMGMNYQYSLNTAQTLAKKQAMLEFFNNSWPQPEEFRDEVRRVTQNKFGAAETPMEIGAALDEVLEKYAIKPKKKG